MLQSDKEMLTAAAMIRVSAVVGKVSRIGLKAVVQVSCVLRGRVCDDRQIQPNRLQ